MTGYNFKKATGKRLWQKSFYDHVVRKEENLNSVAEYIFNNPVRKGMVENYDDYPFLGPKDQWKPKGIPLRANEYLQEV